MANTEEYEGRHSGQTIDDAVSWANTHKKTDPTKMSKKLDGIEEGAQKNSVQEIVTTLGKTMPTGAETYTLNGVQVQGIARDPGRFTFRDSLYIYAEGKYYIYAGGLVDPKGKELWKLTGVYNETSGDVPAEILQTFGRSNATTTNDGLMSKEDKSKLDIVNALFNEDIVLRTTGIKFSSLGIEEKKDLGTFHLRSGEQFVVTANASCDISITSEDNVFDDYVSLQAAGTQRFEAVEVPMYNKFSIEVTDGPASGIDLTIKIEKS